MSENLDKVTNTYKECLYLSYSLILNKWLNFGISESKHKELNKNCMNLSLDLQQCVVNCKSDQNWENQKECWKKCLLNE